MPVVYRFGGVRVVIYPNDHRPAHVHVKTSGSEAVFILHCPDGPPTLRESYGFNRRDLTGIADRLADVLKSLCAEWGAIHDSD